MKSLYLLLDLATFIMPAALSFDRKVQFFKQWKSVFISSLVVGIPFLVWDILFTHHGVWGFNPDYLTGIYIVNLPLEEVLFFIVVPFACAFIYACCRYYFRAQSFPYLNRGMMIAIPIYAGMLLFIGGGIYTEVVTISAFFVWVVAMINRQFKYLFVAFLLSLIPFLLVNGILTGSLSESPVVWYSNWGITGLRIRTIPFEDVLYSFSLIVPTILLHEWISRKWQR